MPFEYIGFNTKCTCSPIFLIATKHSSKRLIDFHGLIENAVLILRCIHCLSLLTQAALLPQRETAAMKAIPVYSIGNVTGCHGDNQLLCPDSQTCCLQGDTCCSQSKHNWMTCCNFSNVGTLKISQYLGT